MMAKKNGKLLDKHFNEQELMIIWIQLYFFWFRTTICCPSSPTEFLLAPSGRRKTRAVPPPPFKADICDANDILGPPEADNLVGGWV